jgi:ferredoxin
MDLNMKIVIVYCSPAGSTRHIAEVIHNSFNQRNVDAVLLDLAKDHDRPTALDIIKTAGQRVCLFIGSPVYRDVAIPPVMNFIEALPQLEGNYAVPFVTWGQACSGVALWQMGAALMKKEFRIAGAAKVVALHSMMWLVDDPAGKGHPDDTDRREIETLVNQLHSRFDSDDVPELSLDDLDYQPPERATKMQNKIKTPWYIIPKNLDAKACTCCGICEEECPVDAVALNPYPEFDQNCIDCFNCIRLCPENAIASSVSMNDIADHIRERVRTINERPLTQVFLFDQPLLISTKKSGSTS